MVLSVLKHTLQFKSCYQYAKGGCQFIAYCVTEFDTVHVSIFAANSAKYKCPLYIMHRLEVGPSLLAYILSR